MSRHMFPIKRTLADRFRLRRKLATEDPTLLGGQIVGDTKVLPIYATEIRKFLNDLSAVLLGAIPYSDGLVVSLNAYLRLQQLGSVSSHRNDAGHIEYIVLATNRLKVSLDTVWGIGRAPHPRILREDALDQTSNADIVQIMRSTLPLNH